jgi:hypothetical protein
MLNCVLVLSRIVSSPSPEVRSCATVREAIRDNATSF